METNNHAHDAVYNVRHSAAHLLAHAVMELFPTTKLTIGPVTEAGFFYDFLPEHNFKEEQLALIENKMREIAARDLPIVGKEISKEQARKLFAGNEFKLELIDQIPDATVSIFQQGDFVDLCKGGHVSSTKHIKYFKLTGISGAYWRADREGIALQRISGVAFATKEDFDAYEKRIEDALLSDHRRLGQQLDLFTFHDEAPGMPFFRHKGLILFNKLVDFIRSLQKDAYQEVRTPMILSQQLWKTSGHLDNYNDMIYFTSTADGEVNCVKPMNCPGGLIMYKEKLHSYRDLPLRVAELGIVHRFELSGVRHGLLRVRQFTQDDAHIYCTPDQAEQEIIGCLEMIEKVYTPFHFKRISMAVSTRPAKSIGTDEMWEMATNALKNALEKHGTPYTISAGEGAFYGPKIEVRVEDAMGREWQLGTIQVDFNLPMRFEIEYIDADQSRKTPVMIHRAIMGSLERFMGILLEHFKGKLPFWLAPEQIRVLKISDQQAAYAQAVCQQFKDAGLQATLDDSSDQISAQIRRAQVEKVPWMVVVGQKEADAGTVTLRSADGKQTFGLTVAQLIERAKKNIETKSIEE
ncbi:MAG: Threonine-tRNA ligase [candidate division TM6 bacterium GW2011_GWF2_38_10]|nr:MAG: Threonine-tRNA ligase [candidate division TM6 bacterium GW2011_GWF2_38_10]